MKYRWNRWWALTVPIVCLAGIYIGSSIPGESLPDPFKVSWDKLYHIIEFAVLALAFTWAIARLKTSGWAPWIPMLALLIAAIYAPLDELHQSHVPGRDASVIDVAADWIGCLVGAWGGFWIRG
jgi:VanZ family protein